MHTRPTARFGLLGLLASLALMVWGLAGAATPAHAAVTTADDVLAAFANGGTLTLNQDVTVDLAGRPERSLVLDSGVSLQLDLGGHNLFVYGRPGLSGATEGDAGDYGSPGMRVSGQLLIRNGALTVHGGAGGSGNSGNPQSPGRDGASGAVGSDGTDGPDGTPGADGGSGGAGLVIDHGQLVLLDLDSEVVGGAGGAGGDGGSGGDGGAGGTGTAGAGGDGGDGGDGARGGNAGNGGVGSEVNGSVLQVGGYLNAVGGIGGQEGAAGAGGQGGAGGTGQPGGTQGTDGSDSEPGTPGTRGADWGGTSTGMTTLDASGAEHDQTGWAWVAQLGDVLPLQELVEWPTISGNTFTTWSEDPEGQTLASPDGDYSGETVYAQWSNPLPCAGPTDAASAATAFSAATDGSTITLCGDITVASTDAGLAVPAATSVTLDLNGHQLTTTGADNHAGLQVKAGAGLIIDDSSGTAAELGTGVLNATGGASAAGLGSDGTASSGTIRISGGTVVAHGGRFGAGIGGGANQGNELITISGGKVTANGSWPPPLGGFQILSAAGIGGGTGAPSGEIIITGGTITATGSGESAGIGSGGAFGGSRSGRVTITGGTVTATGGTYSARTGGAGIGSNDGRDFGEIAISGGTITATGGGGAAGIGGGTGGNATSVTISGGTVTATGGSSSRAGDPGGPGIGSGGSAADGTPVTISAGTVTATGVTGGAGIGGGAGSPGAAVSIGAKAKVSVTSDGGNAVGQGAGTGAFGSLSNAGELTITAGSVLTIPDGVTMTNSGTLITEQSKQSGTPNGAVVNNGIIDNSGTITTPDDVSVHNYLVRFDPNGGSGSATDQVRVYAGTLADGGVKVPADPTRSGGFAFAGWNSAADGSGVDLGASGDLTALGDGPVTVTWYAQWTAPPLVVTTDELPDGTVGVSYEAHLTATGGADSAYTWKLESGELPPGLTLAADGTISGIPTTAGTFEFRVSVNDPAYANLSITIRPADVTAPPTTQPPTTPPPSTHPPTTAPPTSAPPTSPPPLANTGGPGAGGLITGLILLTAGLALVVRRRPRPHRH